MKSLTPSGGSNFEWYSGDAVNTPKMVLSGGGNLSIGTTDARGYKLAVAGSAIATSVTVKLQGEWGDYVFKPDYHLPSLTSVKAYIDKNQHLPEMPTAADIARNGVNLGEMVKLQTKKIEELMLYVIKQQHENERQNAHIAKLEALLSLKATHKQSK